MTNRVLSNNNKPATHFIEVWKGAFDENINSTVTRIHLLDKYLNDTFFANSKTIAIFKIRPKANTNEKS
jgi:hypothetical protein